MISEKQPDQIARMVYDRVKAVNEPDTQEMVAMCEAMAFGTVFELNMHGFPAYVAEGSYLDCSIVDEHNTNPVWVKHYWAVYDGKIFDLTLEQFHDQNMFGEMDKDGKHIEELQITFHSFEMIQFLLDLFRRGYGMYVNAATNVPYPLSDDDES